MQFYRRRPGQPLRLGVLPGSFNPITVAHLALARAARKHCDEVLFVLPRIFPHKEYRGASFGERIELLNEALESDDGFSIGASDRGLFAEIARECREAYGSGTRLSFLCGRDAAERIAGWDYGKPQAFNEMLREFDLLVAARKGEYCPPADISSAIHRLELPEDFDHVSATEVRDRIHRGQVWEHLVPQNLRERVREIYTKEAGQ